MNKELCGAPVAGRLFQANDYVNSKGDYDKRKATAHSTSRATCNLLPFASSSHNTGMAQTRASTSEGDGTERPSKRAKVEPEADLIQGNAVDASLEEEREESPFWDDNVEDTTKAAQGSDLYLDTVR